MCWGVLCNLSPNRELANGVVRLPAVPDPFHRVGRRRRERRKWEDTVQYSTHSQSDRAVLYVPRERTRERARESALPHRRLRLDYRTRQALDEAPNPGPEFLRHARPPVPAEKHRNGVGHPLARVHKSERRGDQAARLATEMAASGRGERSGGGDWADYGMRGCRSRRILDRMEVLRLLDWANAGRKPFE
jgi:hypothetical protein